MNASKFEWHMAMPIFVSFYFMWFFFRFHLFNLWRTTSGTATSSDYTENGLVRDGTPCGTNLVCVNQTCVSLFPHIDQTKCPTNHNNVECYGQGVIQGIIIIWNNLLFCENFDNFRYAQIRIVVFVILVLQDQIVQSLYQLQHLLQPNRVQHLTLKSKWKRKRRDMVSD